MIRKPFAICRNDFTSYPFLFGFENVGNLILHNLHGNHFQHCEEILIKICFVYMTYNLYGTIFFELLREYQALVSFVYHHLSKSMYSDGSLPRSFEISYKFL